VQVLHPPQKFEGSPFWNGCSYGIKNYGIEVTFNGNDFRTEFHKHLPVGSKVDRGTERHTDRVVISLAYFFFPL
jgi:hypothetical protein